MGHKMKGYCLAALVMLFAKAHASISGFATCDNVMKFYADGVLLPHPHDSDWTKASPVSFPDSTQVIAIQCTDVGVVAGIKAEFDNGIVTDKTWKCSNKAADGWEKPGFDDSAWLHATPIPPTQGGPYWQGKPTVLNGGDSSWIWTPNWKGGDKVVYCRKEMPKQDSCCCNHTTIIREPVECDQAVMEELKKLRADVTDQINSLQSLMKDMMETVLQVISEPPPLSEPHPEITGALNDIRSSIRRCCYNYPRPPTPPPNCPPGPREPTAPISIPPPAQPVPPPDNREPVPPPPSSPVPPPSPRLPLSKYPTAPVSIPGPDVKGPAGRQ